MSNDPFSDPGEGYAVERDPVRRSKDGRPYVYDFEKGKEALFTRATTFIDCLEDKSLLARWGERMALLGIRDSRDLGRELMALKPIQPPPLSASVEDFQEYEGKLTTEKRALDDLVSRAKDFAGSRQAAKLGTDLHGLTEILDEELKGLRTYDEDDLEAALATLPDAPPILLEEVRAYVRACRRHRLVPVEVERFVAVDSIRAAGTLDRVYEWHRDGWGAEPLRVIGDVKTGRIDYGQGKLAMQLALYANGRYYDPENPTEREDPEVSTTAGLILHLPAGKTSPKAYEVDLTLGWEGVRLAQKVREWRSRTSRKNAGVLADLDLTMDLE